MKTKLRKFRISNKGELFNNLSLTQVQSLRNSTFALNDDEFILMLPDSRRLQAAIEASNTTDYIEPQTRTSKQKFQTKLS